MATAGGRKLRPLALVCALLFVLWGAASAGSLVAQLQLLDEFGWPDENADGEIWAWTILYLSAAASGCWVALWGLFGLAWRPPLHFGVLALLVAFGTEVSANLVQASYLGEAIPSWDFSDQLQWYGDRVTFESNLLGTGDETQAFFIALPFVTAILPLLCYLVVLFSGAGRKRKGVHVQYVQAPQQYAAPAYQQPYPPQPYQQPYAPQPYAPQPYAPQPYQPYPQAPVQPTHQPPPQPAYQPPPAQPPPQQPQQPQPRVPWQDVPPVVRGRPTPPAPKPVDPPDQHETLPYQRPPGGS
ncbi:hypothetical protein [Nocardioides stalactiti]|uniref:hypothetical protein n=1 Tax=Nocardioides stalactiti TaxID=2755356 RepID=UPI0016049D6B|nr:hypothetical protein [Nocardioides stalactiti]